MKRLFGPWPGPLGRQPRPAPALRRIAATLSLLVGCLAGPSVHASEAFVPGNDSTVVETLRTTPPAAGERSLRSLRDRHRAQPRDAALAVEFAQALIRRGRAEADSRLLSQARAVLEPWLAATNAPPPGMLVLRATIRQSLHDFDGALADLDVALRFDPQDTQAWLTKATVHTVRAEYPQARQACLSLARLADPLTAVTASAQVGGLTGSARASFDLLKSTLANARKSGKPVAVDRLVWAHTLLAEMAARSGDSPSAEAEFGRALLMSPSDPYLLGAYADFLLDEGRPAAVVPLLANFERNDALLLRLAEAEAALQPADPRRLDALVRELTARFDAARLRCDAVHRREEARFRLRLLRDGPTALRLAQENWRVQKEPADARVLLESARASNAGEVVRELLEWVRTTKLEDRKLAGASTPAASPAAGPRTARATNRPPRAIEPGGLLGPCRPDGSGPGICPGEGATAGKGSGTLRET